MDILYLSSLCDDAVYKKVFEKYGRISSYASQKYNRMMVRGLTANGQNVEALSQIVLPEQGEFELPHTISEGFEYIIGGGRLKKILSAYFKIIKWARKHPDGIIFCDILLGELSMALMFAKFFILNKTVAIVTDVPAHRAYAPKNLFRKCTSTLKNKLIERYDGYVFLTEQMNSVVNPRNKPYVVVEGFVDIEMKKICTTLGDKHDKKVCMFAGLLDRVFGVETLVQAFIKADIDDAELHIYGHGDYQTELEEICDRHSNVKYMGERVNSEIVKEELRATLMVNPRPSKDEFTKYSFPSKNLEYIASGTPLLTANLPGMPREYHNYVYIFEKEDVDGLAVNLKTILGKPQEELFEFGMAAKEWSMENKNNIFLTKKIVGLIKEL